MIIAFALLLWGAQMPLFSQHLNNIVDEVIWVVGDEAILRSDVESARLEFGSGISGNPYCVIPEQLAIQKLFLHQAQLDSIDVPISTLTPYVEARLNELVMQAGSKEKLEEYYHKTMTQIREMMFESVKEQETVYMRHCGERFELRDTERAHFRTACRSWIRLFSRGR